MKLYIAGNTLMSGWVDRLEEVGCERGLVSYWDIKKFGKYIYDALEYFKPRELFMDSGAFSAFTQGITIPVGEYCDFLVDHDIKIYSNLDDIQDPDRTLKNQQKMEEHGLKPIPVFHLNEDFVVLEKMLESGYKYISLGVAGTQGQKVCDLFLYRSFEIIHRYWPIKIHGFGITTQRYLERYPFYSVDSTTTIMGGGLGRIMKWDKGKLRSGSYKEKDYGKKLASLVDRGSTQHVLRRKHNIKQHMRLEKQITNLWKIRGVIWDD